MYLKNPNCLNFTHVEPLYEKVKPKPVLPNKKSLKEVQKEEKLGVN